MGHLGQIPPFSFNPSTCGGARHDKIATNFMPDQEAHENLHILQQIHHLEPKRN